MVPGEGEFGCVQYEDYSDVEDNDDCNDDRSHTAYCGQVAHG